MLDGSALHPDGKSLRMEDCVLAFILDCVGRVQQDSGETDLSVIGYCFGGVLSRLYTSIFADGPLKNLICFTAPDAWRPHPESRRSAANSDRGEEAGPRHCKGLRDAMSS